MNERKGPAFDEDLCKIMYLPGVDGNLCAPVVRKGNVDLMLGSKFIFQESEYQNMSYGD